MHIIPAIDLIDGKCVRLTQGDYAQKKVYNEDPLAVAREFESAGILRLHVVDLDGARGGGIVNHKVLERIAGGTNLHIDWGGGMKRDEDLRIAFESGAAQVTGGTIAVKQPDVFLGWLERYGADKIILGTDVKAIKLPSPAGKNPVTGSSLSFWRITSPKVSDTPSVRT
jgi:phosphoribosylformimino-5-aminoimidazole carboxamide ribotide isomerase